MTQSLINKNLTVSPLCAALSQHGARNWHGMSRGPIQRIMFRTASARHFQFHLILYALFSFRNRLCFILFYSFYFYFLHPVVPPKRRYFTATHFQLEFLALMFV